MLDTLPLSRNPPDLSDCSPPDAPVAAERPRVWSTRRSTWLPAPRRGDRKRHFLGAAVGLNRGVAERLRLFHGTNASAVASIHRKGFSVPNVEALAQEIARKFALTPPVLLPHNSFEAGRRHDENVYVSPNFMHAAHYAMRPGELERMLYERAYDELFGEPEWANDPARRTWVREQFPVRPLVAVLIVDAIELSGDEVDAIARHNFHHDHANPTLSVLDLAVSTELATRSFRGSIEVDFCTCRPGDLSIYDCEWQCCCACDDQRARLGESDSSNCLGYWARVDAAPLTQGDLDLRLTTIEKPSRAWWREAH